MINNFLGIDVSKDRFDVFLSFISKKGKRETRKRSFKNDDHEFQGLLSFLQKHNVEEVKACMESTGCYSEALAEFIHNAGHFVSVVNPYCIKSYARSKLVRQKNDQTDAEIIADYCQRQEPTRWAPPSPEKKKLKHLYRCSAALKAQTDKICQKIKKLFILYFLNIISHGSASAVIAEIDNGALSARVKAWFWVERSNHWWSLIMTTPRRRLYNLTVPS